MEDERRDGRALTGTIRLAGAASILIATAIGYFWAPFGSPYTSAGILGGIAAVSFAVRGLFRSKGD
ncbi:hypothetical protein [Roseitalea porphyridii]|uniref:Uncharacterized protein n=1 Tax=Roseitalea porphyridii TaxID=1852022 RepID=A0A4P6V320_9HYPH|nr:hypothetical protein [Roseitalea porphyridii]QBK30850.1 hypothetical protein E0E05_09740 [Roseitalea porphyridii]